MLFESFDAQDLNKELKNIMDGLSVKVFLLHWLFKSLAFAASCALP